MKHRSRIALTGLVAGLAALSCDEGRVVTDIESAPFEAILQAIEAPETLFVGQQAQFTSAVLLGEGTVQGDVLIWEVDPEALLEWDPDEHSSTLSVRVRSPGQVTVTATVDHPDIESQKKEATVTLLLLGVAPLAPADGDTVITSVGDSITLHAAGLGIEDVVSDSAGLTWTRRGSALTALTPLVGRDSLRVTAAAAGTDTLVFSHARCTGVCQDTIFVRVQPVPAAVEATETVKFATLGRTSKPTAVVTDRRGNTIPGAPVTWAMAATDATAPDPDSSVASVAADGTLKARSNGIAGAVATAGAVTDTVVVVVEQVVNAVGAPATLAFSALTAADSLHLVATDSAGSAVMRPLDVTWTIRDSSKVTVTGSGPGVEVTAVAPGSTYVIGTAEGKTDSTLVTVSQSVTSLAIEPAGGTIDALDGTLQLSADVRDALANVVSGAAVTWSLVDATLATVSDAGLVTGVAVGTVGVVATSGGVADTVDVVVRQVPASITVTESVTLDALGAATTLTATVLDANGHAIPAPGTIWTTVSETVPGAIGLAGAVATAALNGTAQVEGKVEGAAGAITDTAAVTVHQAVESVAIDLTSVSFDALGETATATATILDPRSNPVARALTIAWSSDDTGVTTVAPLGNPAQATITAAGNGATNVRVTVEGQSDAVPVSVGQVAATLELDIATGTIDALDGTLQLTATVKDGNGNVVGDAAVVWGSSNEDTATVSTPGGLVTGLGIGTVTITATSGVASDQATVEVRQVPATVVAADETVLLEAFGETHDLTATVFDANSNLIPGSPVTWSILDPGSPPAILLVGSQITADQNGNATVQATAGSATDVVAVEMTQAVTSLQFDVPSLTFAALQTANTVTVTPLDPQLSPVTRPLTYAWSTANAAVAAVEQLDPPESAQITAEANGGPVLVSVEVEGVQDGIPVTVDQVVDTVLVTPVLSATLDAIGATLQLFGSAVDSNEQLTGDAVVWATQDALIASVDGDGTVTAEGDGTTTITASAGGKTTSVEITVEQAAADVVLVDAVTMDAIDEVRTLMPTVLDGEGAAIPDPEVTWSLDPADPPGVVLVSTSGVVTAVGNGIAGVIATSGSVADTATVTVHQLVHEVVLDRTTFNFDALMVDSTTTASVVDSAGNALTRAFTIGWTSTAADKASVMPVVDDEVRAVVRSLVDGTTTVTALVEGKSDAIAVTVAQAVDRVAVTPADTFLNAIGQTVDLAATAFDRNDQEVVGAMIAFASSKPDSASFADPSIGTLTAHAVGTVPVTATADGVVGNATVVVRQVAETVTLTPGDPIGPIFSGDEVSLTVTAVDSNGVALSAGSVTWSSSDATVATVSVAGAVGTVKAQTVGVSSIAEIIAASGPLADPDAADTVEVTVDVPTVTSVVISPEAPADIHAIGGTSQLTAVALNQNNNPMDGETFTWLSLHPDVATVNASGLVEGVSNGTARIEATSVTNTEVKDTAEVVVEQQVASVDLSPASRTYNALTDTQEFTATALDSRGNPVAGAGFTWSDETFGVVSGATGTGSSKVVTAEVVGTSKVIITSSDVPDVTDEALVTVRQVPASVLNSSQATTIPVSGTTTLTAVVRDSADQVIPGATVAWTSSPTSIATVGSASGVVTGVAAGTAQVLATATGSPLPNPAPADTTEVTVASYVLSLDGGDFVNAGDVLKLGSAFTLEAWVKPANNTGTQFLISRGGVVGTHTSAYGLYLVSGQPAVFVRSAGGGNANVSEELIATGTTLSTAEWSHVAATYDGVGTLKLYVNAVEVATVTGTIDPPQIDDVVSVLFGASATTPANGLNGKLDEIRFWNVARSATNLLATYQAPLNGDEAGLIGYWRLDEGTGTTVTDVTSSAIPAAFGGTTSAPIWVQETPVIP